MGPIVLLSIDKSVHLAADQSHGIYDIAKDFFLPIFLALLAAGAAYYIFIRETRRDKKKEEIIRQQRVMDKLTYFAALLSNIIKTATDQHKYLLEWIDSVNKDAISFPLLTYMPIKDLERLVDTDIESYLLAYAEFYSEDRKSSITAFKKIMVNIDFQYHLFKSIFDQLQKGQQFDFERKNQFQELYYKAYNLSGVIINELSGEPEWLQRFFKIIDGFMGNHPGNNYDIQFYFDYYFKPYNDFFTEYISQHPTPPFEITEAAISTRDGKQLFQHIKVENMQLAKDYSKDAERMKVSIDDLTAVSSQLIADFAD